MKQITQTEPEQPGPSSTIAERVAFAMRRRQMSQMDVENEGGLSRGYVSRVVRGERARLSPDVLVRIARGLRVNYGWLATGHGDMDDAEGGPASIGGGARRRAGKMGALEAAIAYHQGKWSAPAVAAARAMAEAPNAEELDPPEWAEVLDQIEAALAKVRLKGRG